VKRNLGTGLLVAGACSACWIAPVLVALMGAGWVGALGAGCAWAVAAGCASLVALVLLRRVRRRRQGVCDCASPTNP
jgi:hypothetical protein